MANPAEQAVGKGRLLVPTLVYSGSLMAIVSSLGAPLIPTIAKADGVSLSTAQWVITITLLTGALATPVMGRIADGPHQREVVLVGLGAVIAGCVLSAASNGFLLLLVGRGFQGIGLGVLPVAMAIARRNLPPDESRRTIALLSITTSVGAGLGYALTALIAELFDFHASYWFGAMMLSGAMVAAVRVLPRHSAVTSRRFDSFGVAVLSLMVITLLLVLSEGGGWGWTSVRTLGAIAFCLVLLAVWIPYELWFADPLVDLRQVRDRSVLTADLAGFLICAAMFLFLPIIVEYAQVPTSNGYGFGASVFVAGLILVPYSAATLLASRFLFIYERRFGVRTIIPLSSILVALTTTFFALEHSALWEAFVTAGIVGLAMGFCFGAMPGLIVRAVPKGETGSATGFYQVIRGIGMSVGSAVAGAVLLAHTRHGQSLPDEAGFQTALMIAAGLGIATAFITYVLPGKGIDAPTESDRRDRPDVALLMEEEAELAGAGFTLNEENFPLERESAEQ